MRFLILLLLSGSLFAQTNNSVKTGSVPGWVKSIDYPKNVKDTANTSGGYYDLLAEEQYNQLTQESYYRYAQSIISEKGLGNISTLSVSYDPAYQSILFHSISLIRRGSRIDQLRTGKFEVFRREQNLERSLYDGDLTVVFNLEDVQVGDVIEYSYSILGTNPVFQKKIFKIFYFNFGVPVGHAFYRVLTPINKPYYIKKFNQAPDAVIEKTETTASYEWTAQSVPAQLVEEGIPSWYDPYNYVQVSEFEKWDDVAAWAYQLFKIPDTHLELAKKIGVLQSNLSKGEAIRKAIRFVQDEVRYLSFSDGIHGYKPHDPKKVLDQRFGDCKDKSLLLSHIFNEMGLTSKPVLINTRYGKGLPDLLPAPNLFDHCIVQLAYQDTIYWIDPTISFQRGPFQNLYLPAYENGLIIDTHTKGLTPILQKTEHGSIKTEEVFQINSIGGSATLEVKTIYKGGEADYIREYFKGNSLTEINRQYVNFYATDYPDIDLAESIEFTDDEASNQFVTREHYDINQFWEFDSVLNKHSALVYPRSLASYLKSPSIKLRQMPYSIAFPLQVRHHIQLHMPEAWSLTSTKKTIETSGFIYNSKSEYENKVIDLDFNFKTKRSFINTDEVKEHVRKVKEAIDDMSFNVYYTHEAKSNKAFNIPFLLILLVVILFSFFAFRKMYEFDPTPRSEPEFNSIGGWLILPAIGLSISPFKMLFDFIQLEYFNYSNWRVLTDPTFSSYNPALGAFVLLEMIFNVLLIFYVVVLLILFFKRRSSVPVIAAAFYGLNLFFLIGDALAVQYFNPTIAQNDYSGLFRSMASAAIWIPYFLISERSLGTFTLRNSE